jgi:hypothetical protein
MFRFLIVVSVAAFAITGDTLPSEAQPKQILYQIGQVPANVRGELHADAETLVQDYRGVPSQLWSWWNQVHGEARSLRADARADARHIITSTMSRSTCDTR